MEIDKLIEQLKQGTFYYYKLGLFIKSPVTNVLKFDKNSFSITFHNGTVDVFLDIIKSCKMPLESKSFKWCYELKNYYGDIIGYIGKEIE